MNRRLPPPSKREIDVTPEQGAKKEIYIKSMDNRRYCLALPSFFSAI